MKQYRGFEPSREIRARRGIEDFLVTLIGGAMMVAVVVILLSLILAVHPG